LATGTATKLKEDEIIALLQQRDRRAISVLYDQYSVALHGVIFNIVQSQETAEDLLQETFVKIWLNFSTYDAQKGRLYTWMLNIARNLAIDKTRSSKFAINKKIQNIDKSVNAIDSEHEVVFETDHIGLRQVVEQLRPEQKELIDLVYFYGFTQAEAAEKLGVPLGTVKTRIRSAMGELRKIFTN